MNTTQSEHDRLARRAQPWVLASALVMVLSACGGSSSDEPAGSTSGSTSSSSSSSSSGSSSGSSGGAVISDSAACVASNTVPTGSSSVPQNLCVPTLAYDDSSIVLVWDKPASYANVIDYKVYQNGKLLGSVSDYNKTENLSAQYIENFYKTLDTDAFHTRIQYHNYKVSGLKPATQYSFTVRAVLKDGSESADSPAAVQTTAGAYAKVVDLSKEAGVTAGDISDAAAIKANTVAFQKAIDSCANGSKNAYGCKVSLPAGVFMSGALFLRSNMTFEVQLGSKLKGSPYADDYPRAKGYLLYKYRPTRRPPSLLNALADNDQGSTPAGTFENIRIVGKGALDGNGWLTGLSSTNTAAEITDEMGNKLPQIRASNSSKVATDGILAKAQVAACLADASDPAVFNVASEAYGNCRSSLVTLRGVRNVYYADFTALNPAFHGVMNLETENVVLNGLIHKTYDGNNADGIEMGNSRNALVFNNFFDTGDDSMNFAAGFGAEAAKQEVQSGAWIFNNYFREGHGAVVAGSHTGAWIEKIKAEDNVMYLTDIGLRNKTTPNTGGGGRDFLFRDNAMKNISTQAFIFTSAYSLNTADYVPAATPAQFRDIIVRNVTVDGASVKNDGTATGSSASIEVAGSAAATFTGGGASVPYADAYHENLLFDNVKLRNVRATKLDWLKNASFKDVTFVSLQAGATNPWVLTNSTGNTFSGTTAQP